MAQLVASVSGVVLGGVAEVVYLNLARGKIFTASIGSVDSLYLSVYIYIYIPVIPAFNGILSEIVGKDLCLHIFFRENLLTHCLST